VAVSAYRVCSRRVLPQEDEGLVLMGTVIAIIVGAFLAILFARVRGK
jgi:hypothetical protein